MLKNNHLFRRPTYFLGAFFLLFTGTIHTAQSCPITAVQYTRVNVSSCSGTPCDGSATVTGTTGGSGTYTYLWSNGQTGPTATGLCPGNVSVTVTDGSGLCSFTQTFPILRGNAGSQAPLDDTLHVTMWTSYPQAGPPWYVCQGQCVNVWVEIDTSTGGGPYIYDWSLDAAGMVGPGPHQFCPMTPPTYRVTVTDAACLTTTIISTPEIRVAPLLLTTGSVDATCFGSCDGEVTVNASGATAPYTYLWSNGQTTPTNTQLCPGPYSVEVRDSWGCRSTATGSVNDGIDIIIDMSNVNDVSCAGGNDGSATANATTGEPPFTYSWNTAPVQNTPTASNLTAGTYTVTVTDNKGCTKTQNVTINQPPPLAANATSTPAACGASDGTATVNASGGTGPYTYSWAPSGQTGATANGLAPGIHTATVTDANGCTQTASTTVAELLPPTASITGFTNVTCNGANNGSATVAGAGGVTPYTYSWNTAPVQNTATANNLPPGNYIATVTDVNGCTATANATITEPAPITFTLTKNDASCGASNGSASVTNIAGGTGGYTYSWAPMGGTGATANNLPQGNYTVTVTDANGCVETDNITVNASAPPDVAITGSTNVTCNNGNNGTATALATGGTAPYNYSWNTNPIQNTATATNLEAGTYTVTVLDLNGCSDNASVTISQPPAITLSVTKNDATCGEANGSATANPSGGAGGFTYQWNTIPAQSTVTASNLMPGTYTVTVTDANGCTQSGNITVNDTPGPTAGFTFSNVCVNSPATFTNTSTNGVSYDWNMGDGNTSTQTSPTHTYTTAGTYSVRLIVTSSIGCRDTITQDITILPLPVIDFSAPPVTGCSPVIGIFTNNNPLPGGTCLWNLGDGTTSTDCNSVTHTYTNPGCYDITLTVTSADGCTNQQTQNDAVCVTGVPNADFTMSPGKVPEMFPEMTFINLSTGADTYYWEFDGGQAGTSTATNPSVNFTGLQPRTYDACLWASNNDGCIDSICKAFSVYSDFLIYVPNTFTPDDDGINEIFLPIISGHSEDDYKLYIFNRWGDLIFETDNPSKGWDGFHNGVKAKTDVYVWKIKVKPLEHPDIQEYIGHVNLLK